MDNQGLIDLLTQGQQQSSGPGLMQQRRGALVQRERRLFPGGMGGPGTFVATPRSGPPLRPMMTEEEQKEFIMPLNGRQTMMPPGAPEPRQDGGVKGRGWLGPLQRADGRVSTELSMDINVDGQRIDLPLLVPTLTSGEVRWLLDNDVDPKSVPQSIIDKAEAHAFQRIRKGLSPFYD